MFKKTKENNTRQVVVYELDGINVLILIILRLLGFRINYVKSAAHLSLYVVKILEVLKIVPVSTQGIPDAFVNYIKLKDTFSEVVLKSKLINSDLYVYTLNKLSSIGRKTQAQSRFNLVLRRYFMSQNYSLFKVIYFAREFTNAGYSRVYIWNRRTFWYRTVKDVYGHKYINLYPPIFTKFAQVVGLVINLARLIKKRITRKQSNDEDKTVTLRAQQEEKNLLEAEVLFFPHNGIFYDEFYKKDHYYSSKAESPFYESRIAHLGLGDTLVLTQKSIEYYKSKNILYGDLVFMGQSSAASSVNFIRGILGKPKLCLQFLYKVSIDEVLTLVGIYGQIIFYYNALSKFKKAKIALIGFDVGFPSALSFALDMHKITTVATQERFLAAWYESHRPMVDLYLTQGPEVTDMLRKSESTGYIEKLVTVGPARLDNIYNQCGLSFESKYDKYKNDGKKIILALDYHSARSADENRLCLINTWELNKKFYFDILKLCTENPRIHVVIKGKNYAFLGLPEFSDVVKCIKSTENISVETDYKVYTPEKMIAIADATIAAHTSLGDEILAAGKPLVFYDYTGVPSKIFNYLNIPVIVDSYNDLQSFINCIVEGKNYLTQEQKETLMRRLYNHSYDGRVRDRIQSELEAVYVKALRS